MVALGVGSVVLAGFMATSIFAARSFVAMGNYFDLSSSGQYALDRLSRDIRQSDYLSNYTTTSFSFQTTDPISGNRSVLTYTYDPTNQTLVRTLGPQSDLLLEDCVNYQFVLFQRDPALTNGGDLIAFIPTNSLALIKAIEVSWTCARTNLGASRNFMDAQSARIVIRKD